MKSESSVKDELNDIDLLRSRLEETVANLKRSLQTWRIWEAEFEGLKEEILTLPEEPSRDDLMELGREYGGRLVDETEMQTLFQGPSHTQRTKSQIVDVLSRRIDYVRQNVQTVEKQLQAAEIKLDSVSSNRTAHAEDENGLPFTEIREDLDEEGNVISSVKSTPGSATPEIIQALEKAGITEAEDETNKTESSKNLVIKIEGPSGNDEPDKQRDQLSRNSASNPYKSIKRKKSVRFTEDTKSEDAPSKASLTLRPKSVQNGPKKATAIKRSSFPSKVLYQREEAEDEQFSPIIPVNESPEDAALRREMLQYGLSEVGAVVAELNIDEGEEEDEDGSDDPDDLEHAYDDEEDDLDEEDKYGRTTRRVISEAYIEEMKALQKRLEAHRDHQPSKEQDIKSATKPESKSTTSSIKPKQNKPPISDTIIEHAHSPGPSTFGSTAAQEPDDLDPAILKQEIAVEYHNMRNRMIHRQGGFLSRQDEEEEEQREKVPLTSAEGGSQKRVSRFKAARLGR